MGQAGGEGDGREGGFESEAGNKSEGEVEGW